MSCKNITKIALPAALVSLGFAFSAIGQSPSTATPSDTSKSTTGSGTASSKSDAASKGAGGKSQSSQVAPADRTFMEKAAKGGTMEVELGRVAEQKAANAQVKQFGARMVQDHSKANDELKAIASSKGVNLPADAGEHKKDIDKMSRLQGPEFDREYMKHMVSDHKKDVSEFEKASKSAKDADVKGFASKTLPVLREHLKLAQDTEKAVKSSGSSGSSGAGSKSGSASGSSGTSQK
jgi:putative membrane protein